MERQTLADFSAGEWGIPDVDIKVPGKAASALIEAFIDDSGVVRARGQVSRQIATALPRALGEFVWAGTLLPGQRGLCFSRDAGSNFGLYRAFDAAGAAFAAVPGFAAFNTYQPRSWTVVGNALWIGASINAPGQPTLRLLQQWGGSYGPASASPGPVDFTAGSKAVLRAAGGLTVNAPVGSIMTGYAAAPGFIAVVAEAISDTEVRLDRPAPATSAGAGATFTDVQTPTIAGVAAASIVGSVAGRLLLMVGNKLYFSDGPNPVDGSPRTSIFPARNVHEFPIDAQGVALATLRDQVFVGTNTGIYGVSGMAYEIVDGSGNSQHPIEEITSKSIMLGQSGIVKWQGSLIVPCRDGLYAMDGYGAPVLLSRSVPWAQMVREGMQVGFASIYKGRYLMPFRMADDQPAQTMVFRMDGLETEQGVVFSRSTLTPPSNVFAYSTGPAPDQLLAVGASAAGVLDARDMFTTSHALLDWDADETVSDLSVVTKAIVLGDKSLVRRVRVRLTYTGDGAPLLNVDLYPDSNVVTSSAIPLVSSDVPQWVAVDFAAPAETHSVRVGLGLTAAAASNFAVHAVEVHYRAFGGR